MQMYKRTLACVCIISMRYLCNARCIDHARNACTSSNRLTHAPAFAGFCLHWLPSLRIATHRSYACALRIAYRVSRSHTAYPYPVRVPARATHMPLSIPVYPLKFQLPQRFSRILNRLSSSPVTVALLQRVAYTLAGGDMLRSDPR